MKFIITIDTEADNQWKRSEHSEINNIEYIPRFQELCDQFGFKPTYLITYEMAVSERFIKQIGRYQHEGRAEIGAHLHPWSNPPLIQLTEDDVKYHPFPHEYSEDVLREKLLTLTNTIEQNFGTRPRTFRAGRYGFDGNVASILSEFGYLADCSVTPFVSWKHIMGNPQGKGGPDFSGKWPQPSRFDSGLLEVPVSIFFIQNKLLNRIFHHIESRFSDPHRVMLRGLYKLGIKPVWMRPNPKTTVHDLIRVYEMAHAFKLDYIEMIFHSSELMAGGSKNTTTHASIEQMYALFTSLFQFLAHKQIAGVTLTDYAKSHLQKS